MISLLINNLPIGLTEKEKVSLSASFKIMGLSREFIIFIINYLINRRFTFDSFEEFSKKYPELTTDVREKCQNKFLINGNNFCIKEKYKEKIEFINYSSGAKVFTKILRSLIGMQVLNIDMISTISNLFYNTVVESEGTFTKNFQTSKGKKEIFEIKSPINNKYNFYEVIYFKINISSKVDKGFFCDSSITTIEYELRTERFYSVNELIHWSCD